MNNPVAIIQARMGSRRLPGKVLRTLADGESMLWHVVQRVRAAAVPVIVTCPATVADMPLVADCKMADITVHSRKGNPDDVLSRYYDAATRGCLDRFGCEADPIIRITADCPLVDPGVIRKVLTAYRDAGDDPLVVGAAIGEYSGGGVYGTSGYPDGLDVEVIRLAALRMAWANATSPYDREHVTPWLWNTHSAQCQKVWNDDLPHDNTKLSVDTEDDFLRVQAIYATHYKQPDKIFPASRFVER